MSFEVDSVAVLVALCLLKQRAKFADASCVGFDVVPAEVVVAFTTDRLESHTSLMLIIVNVVSEFNVSSAVFLSYISNAVRLYRL